MGSFWLVCCGFLFGVGVCCCCFVWGCLVCCFVRFFKKTASYHIQKYLSPLITRKHLLCRLHMEPLVSFNTIGSSTSLSNSSTATVSAIILCKVILTQASTILSMFLWSSYIVTYLNDIQLFISIYPEVM